MEKVRVSENVKICFTHPYCGWVNFPVDKVETERKTHSDGSEYECVTVFFTKRRSTHDDGETVTLRIDRAMGLIAQHIKENNAGAEQHAIERGYSNRLDRYIVKDMCVEEIWFVDGGMQLYCSWEDCSGNRRTYCGEVCKVFSAYKNENDLYVRYRKPTFYF